MTSKVLEFDFTDSKKPAPKPRLGASFGTPTRARPTSSTSSTTVGSRPTSSSRPLPTFGARKEFNVGDEVGVRKPNNQPGYNYGKISNKNSDGTYDVKLEDGKREYSIPANKIMKRDLSSQSKDTGSSKAEKEDDSLRFGTKVEIRRDGEWKQGIIVDSKGESCVVKLDGTGREVSVAKELVRSKSERGKMEEGKEESKSGNGRKEGAGLKVGVKVEANYRGRGRYFPGKISRDRGDGTYDIDYDDGETEMKVKEEWIKLVDVGDGTYDIDYDDGETEMKVKEEWIKLVDGGGRSGRSRSRSPSRKPKLEKGSKVEANYRGRGRYFPGKISRDRGDGTYDIDYDDGEIETRVKEEWVRLSDGGGSRGGRSRSPSPRRKPKLEEGAKVEANYRGRGKYYPGRIKAVRLDGTFDIDYDDGEIETRVKEEWVRLLDGGGSRGRSRSRSPSPRRKSKLEKGGGVEWTSGGADTDTGVEEDWSKPGGRNRSRSPPRRPRSLSPALSLSFIVPDRVKRDLSKVFTAFQKSDVTTFASFLEFDDDKEPAGTVSKKDFKSCVKSICSGSNVKMDDILSDELMNVLLNALSFGTDRSIVYDTFNSFLFDFDSKQDPDKLFSILKKILKEFSRGKISKKDILRHFSSSKNFKKGYVNNSEAEKVLRKIFPIIDTSETKEIISKFDVTSEGVFDYQLMIYWLFCGSSSENLQNKFLHQVRLLDKEKLESSLKKYESSRGYFKVQNFHDAIKALGLVLTDCEVYHLFELLDKEKEDKVSLSQILDFISKNNKPERTGRRTVKSDFRRYSLISIEAVEDIQKALKRFTEDSKMSIGRLCYDFSVDGYLTKRDYRRLLGKLTIELPDKDEKQLFQGIDGKDDEKLHYQELILFLMFFTNQLDDQEIFKIIKAIFKSGTNKRMNDSDALSAMIKKDTEKVGYVDHKEIDKIIKKLGGSNLKDDQRLIIKEFFDPNTNGELDYFYIIAWIATTLDSINAEKRLKRGFQLLRKDDAPYRSDLRNLEGNRGSRGQAYCDDVHSYILSLSIMILPSELNSLLSKIAVRGGDKIDIDRFIEWIENKDDRFSSIADIRSKLESSEGFGRDVYKKICKLRSDRNRYKDFRKSIFDKDDELKGYLTSKEFESCLRHTKLFDDEDIALILENFTIVGKEDGEKINYPMFLLILLEPLNSQILLRGLSLMEKLIRRDGAAQVRQFPYEFFEDCTEDDSHHDGKLSSKKVLKNLLDDDDDDDDNNNRDDKDGKKKHGSNEIEINKLMKEVIKGFVANDSDKILYPELSAFFQQCINHNVFAHLSSLFEIRKKQGLDVYDFFRQHEAANSAATRLDKSKFSKQMIRLGIFLPESSLNLLYSKYTLPDNKTLDVKKTLPILENFSDGTYGGEDALGGGGGLNVGKGGEGGFLGAGTSKADRKEVSALQDDVGVCEISQKILAKYDEKLVRALQIAFDLFDKSGNNEIPTVELERVLCSVGYFISIEELEDLISKIDKRNVGLMEFNEFIAHVVPFIRSKYKLAASMSLEKLYTLFRKYDVSKDGLLQHNEFKHILQLLSKHVKKSEVTGIMEFLDVDGDGSISWPEFARAFEIVYDDRLMNQLPIELRTALRKLQYSGLPDPEEYLTMFIGLPFNYRMSVLSDLEKNFEDRSLQQIVCETDITNYHNGNEFDKFLQFEVQVVRVSGVPSEENFRSEDVVSHGIKFAICQTNKPPVEGEPGNPPLFLGNVTKLHASSHINYPDKWIFSNLEEIDPDKSCFVRCSASETYRNMTDIGNDKDKSKENNNVPPNEQLYLFIELITTIKLSREYKITKNGLRRLPKKKKEVEEEDSNGKDTKNNGNSGKNVNNTNSNNNNQNKKPRDLNDATKSIMNSFLTGLRLRGNKEVEEYDRKRDASDSSDDEDRKGRRNRRSRNKSKRRSSSRRGRKSRSRGRSRSDDESSDDDSDKDNDEYLEEDGPEEKYVDMCCGWTMIPIAATLRGNARKFKVGMCGGTPFGLVAIKDEEVKQRPGVWQSLKRAFGFKVKSVLEILITASGPSPKWISENVAKKAATGVPSAQNNRSTSDNAQILLTSILPPNIVIPTSSVTIVGIFRKLLRDSFKLLDQSNRILPQTGVLHHADPLLSTFPRVLADAAGSRVLLLLWKQEFPAELNGKTYKDMSLLDTSNVRALQVFRNVILHLYNAFSCPALLPDKLKPFETEVELQLREKRIKEFIGMTIAEYSKSAVNQSMILSSITKSVDFNVNSNNNRRSLNLRSSSTTLNSNNSNANSNNNPNNNNNSNTNAANNTTSGFTSPNPRNSLRTSKSTGFFGFGKSNTAATNLLPPPDPNQGALVGSVVVTGDVSTAPRILSSETNQASPEELRNTDFNNQLITPFNTRELMYTGRVFKL